MVTLGSLHVGKVNPKLTELIHNSINELFNVVDVS